MDLKPLLNNNSPSIVSCLLLNKFNKWSVSLFALGSLDNDLEIQLSTFIFYFSTSRFFTVSLQIEKSCEVRGKGQMGQNGLLVATYQVLMFMNVAKCSTPCWTSMSTMGHRCCLQFISMLVLITLSCTMAKLLVCMTNSIGVNRHCGGWCSLHAGTAAHSQCCLCQPMCGGAWSTNHKCQVPFAAVN